MTESKPESTDADRLQRLSAAPPVIRILAAALEAEEPSKEKSDA